MAKNKIAVVDVDLDGLAELANAKHFSGTSKLVGALKDYAESGEALTKAKLGVPQGTWIPWLEANFASTPRQAQKYMKLWKEWDTIKLTNSNAPLDSALDQLKQITVTDTPEAEVDEKVDADALKHVTSQRDEWKETSLDWEKKAEGLTKELNELKTSETPGEVSADVEKLVTKRKLIMEDINGAEEAKKAIKTTREMLTKQLSAIPALNINARVRKVAKPDVVALVELIENLAVALKEKFNV